MPHPVPSMHPPDGHLPPHADLHHGQRVAVEGRREEADDERVADIVEVGPCIAPSAVLNLARAQICEVANTGVLAADVGIIAAEYVIVGGLEKGLMLSLGL